MAEQKEPTNLIELLQQLKEHNIPEEKYKSHIDRFLHNKAIKNVVPYSGTLELTPYCNLDCKMCYVHLNKEQLNGAKLLTVEEWKSLIKQAHDAGMRTATLTGGECLLHPDFDEIYLYLQSFGIEVSIKTNGTLLNAKRIAFFQEHPPVSIEVTLYGSCNEVYEAVTGSPQFDTVWKNIAQAKEANLPISVMITPNAFMGNDGIALIEKIHSADFRFEINARLFEPRENTGRRGDKMHASTGTYIDMYTKSMQLNGRKIHKVPIESLPEPKTSGEATYGIPCIAGKSRFHINWKGEMLPCTNIPTISAEPLVDGFENCWQKIHQAVLAMEIPMECAGCPYQRFCGCVGVHYQNGSTAHCNKAWCEHIKQLTAAGIAEIEQDC
ncbi:MAG TPA: hypothetical protein DDY98_09310 [Ruminococcaceae bacterium]|nr:hypothetical protein [Oscillospiraceae bacterium]